MRQNIYFLITIGFIIGIIGTTLADVKVLYKKEDNDLNKEISLSTNEDTPDGELIIKGSHSINLNGAKFLPERDYNLIVEYVADKNGYRAKYILSSKPTDLVFITLTPNALKTAAG
ncbi:uncharacterized protein LOC119676521 [Teleopsis dalmanni]|uniref:uncharacterized protein LOC119676521 n=1 Tax=Teleopsis dalmanni TaxID=139649 RepID=UPI0018CCFEA2|nr:uncharacterized protein LOC119676521 [Teleopsis dalmanni]